MKGSDRDVSTVVLRVFLFQMFPFILVLRTRAILASLKNSLVHVISKLHSKPCYYLYLQHD